MRQSQTSGGLSDLSTRVLPEAAQDRDLIGLVEKEMLGQGITVSHNGIASFIRKNYSAESEKKLYATQIQRVLVDGYKLPKPIRKGIITHFENHEINPEEVREFERYFIAEPTNTIWWNHIGRNLQSVISDVASNFFGNLFIFDSEGNVQYRDSLAYALFSVESMESLQDLSRNFIVSYNPEHTNGNTVSVQVTDKNKGSFVIMVPWKMSPKYASDTGKLGNYLNSLGLSICFYCVNLPPNPICEGLEDKVEVVREKVERVALNYTRPFVNTMMMNWISLHRELPLFSGMYKRIFETA